MSSEKTTLWVSKSTKEMLAELGRKGETYDSIIQRLLTVAQGEVDIYVDVLSIDGGDPKQHCVVLRLGDYVYGYEKGEFRLIRKETTLPQFKLPIGVRQR